VTKLTEPLIKLAHETGAHIHCLHHAGKGERESIDASLGSTALTGFVDTVVYLKRHGDRTRTLETIQRTGTDLAVTVVVLDTATGRVTLGGSLEEQRKAAVIPAVLAAVGPGVRTEEKIREAVGGNQGLTGKAIRKAYEDGRLVRDGGGIKGDPFRYFLPDEPRDSDDPAVVEGCPDETVGDATMH
jgi:hypothetical protein